MNIVCAFDDNYLPHCAAMLTTLRTANPDHFFHVSLIHSGGNLSDASKLYQYTSSILDRVSLIQFDTKKFDKLPSPGYVTAATYVRLALPGILPAEFDRVLYLDPDIAVIGDLHQLYESDLKGHPLGAVSDYDGLQESSRLCLEPDSGYFNAGVLLIDLTSWRRIDILEDAYTFIRNYPDRIAQADQDVLNHQFQGNWLRLDQRWNYQSNFVFDELNSNGVAQVNPFIVHFTGERNYKPWHFKCVNPYCSIFREAKSLTPWAKIPLLTGRPPSLTIKIKSWLKKRISYFGFRMI